MFTKVCGKVALVTTMWSEVLEDVAQKRERMLMEQDWREMIQGGTMVMRFNNTFESAWEIVDRIFEPAPTRKQAAVSSSVVHIERSYWIISY
jgi:hypothetical protein